MVSAEEELNLPLSPAMDALLRVHKRIIDVDTNFAHATSSSVGTIITRVLVADTQAWSLIGKQGSTIKSIQDASNCTIRVLSAGILEKYYFPYKNVRLLFFFLFEDFEILFLFPHPPPKHPPPRASQGFTFISYILSLLFKHCDPLCWLWVLFSTSTFAIFSYAYHIPDNVVIFFFFWVEPCICFLSFLHGLIYKELFI